MKSKKIAYKVNTIILKALVLLLGAFILISLVSPLLSFKYPVKYECLSEVKTAVVKFDLMAGEPLVHNLNICVYVNIEGIYEDGNGVVHYAPNVPCYTGCCTPEHTTFGIGKAPNQINELIDDGCDPFVGWVQIDYLEKLP